jgi:hypothetical protein
MVKNAERQRAYRARMRRGQVVVMLELDAETIDKLEVASPKLATVDVDDPHYRTLLAEVARDFLSK